MARVYSVTEIEVAIKALQAFKEGVYVPDETMEALAIKLAATAVSAALSIVATGLGEIIQEHERANSGPN
jgi:hypothetical protein